MPRLAWPLLLLLIAGCVSQLAQRQAYLSQFIGKPEQVLVQQLGVPSRSYTTGDTKYLAYSESRVELLPGLPPGPGPWWFWDGAWSAPQAVNLNCETTFTVTDGTVKSYTLRGNACG